MYIVKSALGHYEVTGDAADADVIGGQSFGTSIEEGSANWALARYMEACDPAIPLVADRSLADAFEDKSRIAEIIEGSISNTSGTEGGSRWVLEHLQRFMVAHELRTAMLVAHKNHIGRVALQAKHLGMEYVLPP